MATGTCCVADQRPDRLLATAVANFQPPTRPLDRGGIVKFVMRHRTQYFLHDLDNDSNSIAAKETFTTLGFATGSSGVVYRAATLQVNNQARLWTGVIWV